ncbi:hypothetical protein [Shewanella baltica]|uniref:hypothetical protein n=1 Tax=Shewanella baltica TaxID=62322 RepID=UPI00217E11BF|nr:hypothetical protein [Shewanella baltica]MCS6241505.1 hypothetical protein [Shewanella baltica]
MNQLNGYDETGVGSTVSLAEKRRNRFTGAGSLYINGVAVGALTTLNMAVKAERKSDKKLNVERDMSVSGSVSLGIYPATQWIFRAFFEGWKTLPRGKVFRRWGLRRVRAQG